MGSLVLVQGCGDIGSAVAHALFRHGAPVVLHDEPRPSHPRRGMAFTDALFEGSSQLDGVLAKKAHDLRSMEHMLECHRAIPATDAPVEDVVRTIHPRVVVEARMRKHRVPPTLRGMADLTIGLGDVLREGATRPLAGEPRVLGGVGRERFAYASVDGVFGTRRAIGERVSMGDEIGRVGTEPVRAHVAGIIRGLSHDGAFVVAGAKVLEIDPRNTPGPWSGLGERPLRIAQGVMAAIQETRS